jgi:hypothetical protein
MSLEYTGMAHCLRCNRTCSSCDLRYETRGFDQTKHWYCPHLDCSGHSIDRSLYWMTIESA